MTSVEAHALPTVPESELPPAELSLAELSLTAPPPPEFPAPAADEPDDSTELVAPRLSPARAMLQFLLTTAALTAGYLCGLYC